MSKLLRYYHTIMYLRPVQILGRIEQSVKKRLYRDYTGDSPLIRDISIGIALLDTDAEYLARFSPELLFDGRVCLLNEEGMIDFSDEARKCHSPLWSYNLHYFEYGVALGVKYKQSGDQKYAECFKTLYRRYIQERGNYAPYVVSLHLVDICIALSYFNGAFDDEFVASVRNELYKQYVFLKHNSEVRLLGNHYFENLKAIVICSLLFGENNVFRKNICLFLRQLNEQILPDGVHFELSPMYHKLILEDTMRVASVLRQSDRAEYAELLPYIQKMTDAMCSLERGMGRTPLFNDSGNNVSKSAASLTAAAKALFGIVPNERDALPNSGYYKLYDGNMALLFDCGKIGPDYMPGHGHCDCMSFELSLDGEPLFVNSGTYQYQGKYRNYFRSTRAHNTVVIGGHEQSECWGEHRVARRVRVIEAEKKGQMITGTCVNYFGERHTRMLSLSDGALIVLDSTEESKETIHSFLHIAPGFEVFCDNERILVTKNQELICEIFPLEDSYKLHTSGELCRYAPEFGSLSEGVCIEFSWNADHRQHGYTIKLKMEESKHD